MTPRWSAAKAGHAAAALLAVFLALPRPAASQNAAGPREPGSELSIFVMTMGPGDEVWERYGHNALWISDAASGTNKTYNWGIFDASDPDFIVRFVRGRMRYWMESVEVERVVEFYRRADRSITVQRLALAPAQRVALQQFVEWNAREENKYYWYDYFRDNCSTRLRDALDRALGGELKRATGGIVTSHTYRSESVRLMEGMALTQFGIALGLGPRSDQRMTAWEEMFVPMRMRDRLRQIRIPGPDGSLIPLVAAEHQLYVARRAPELAAAPPLTTRYFVVGAAVAVLFAGLGYWARAGGRAGRATFGVASTVWGAAVGLGGLVLLFIWFGTHHVFAYRNENVLQLNPLALGLAVVVPFGLPRARTRRLATRLILLSISSTLLGLALKPLPGFVQENHFIVALMLPAQLALAWAFFGLEGAAVVRGMPAGAAPATPPGRDRLVRRTSRA